MLNEMSSPSLDSSIMGNANILYHDSIQIMGGDIVFVILG